ncbi:DEAD/DEAH box helicase [Nanoarchaeota archaeon]
MNICKKLPSKQENSRNFDEKVHFDKGLKVVESVSKGDLEVLQKVKDRRFEARKIFDLKFRAEEIAKSSEIKELISYPSIKKRLAYNLPHQQKGALRILRDMDGRALLADEVGLGKTITAGMVLKECIARGFVKRALILTPPSLVLQWQEELRSKFELDFKNIENEKEWENTEFAIASIDKLRNFNVKTNTFKHSRAHEIYWDIIIIDEAHKLKDKKTYRWRFVDKLQKKRFLLLTATPFQNNLVELYNLFALLKRGHLGTFSEFRRRFLHKGNERHPLNPDELKQKLGEVMVRRMKKEISGIVDIKRIPKIQSVVLTKEEKEVYKSVLNLLVNHYKDFNENPINTTLATYAILPKITSSTRSATEFLENIFKNPKYSVKTRDLARFLIKEFKDLKKDTKINVLLDVVSEIVKNSKKTKILLYTKHPATLKSISEALKKRKFRIVEFQGGLSPVEKNTRIKEFENKAQIMVSTDTGAEGLNLQFCNNLINYDLPWNPMAVEQRIGRLDRIGQKKDIKVYNLATKDTMEEHVVDLIINKMCCIGMVMGELPILLFNMGLDSKGVLGTSKFEEKLMYAFLDSKNNLDNFESTVKKIGDGIAQGMKEYGATKKYNSEFLK